MREYFNLTQPFQLEVGDITALIYSACAVLGVCGYDVSILFLIGSIISTAFCWQARRVNLIVLNVSLLIFNLSTFF